MTAGLLLIFGIHLSALGVLLGSSAAQSRGRHRASALDLAALRTRLLVLVLAALTACLLRHHPIGVAT